MLFFHILNAYFLCSYTGYSSLKLLPQISQEKVDQNFPEKELFNNMFPAVWHLFFRAVHKGLFSTGFSIFWIVMGDFIMEIETT